MNESLIKAVITTLDDIEVKGRDNLDKLLGCINALESVVKNMEREAKKPELEEDHNG